MPRIIWRRRGVEWVGRLTAAGPDRFAVAKAYRHGDFAWKLSDLQTGRVGTYDWLRNAKDAAETLK